MQPPFNHVPVSAKICRLSSDTDPAGPGQQNNLNIFALHESTWNAD
jgi:hypothetical protein